MSKIITRTQSTGRESNPRLCITGAASCRWTTSAFVFELVPSVGPEGLEPSLSRLRAGRAAANTLIPSVVSASFSARGVGAEGVEPSSRSYKEHALTLELRAVVCVALVSGAEGSRTLTVPLKRRERYRYATTPNLFESDVYVSRCVRRACRVLLRASVVRDGVEPSPTTYQIAMLPLQHRTISNSELCSSP